MKIVIADWNTTPDWTSCIAAIDWNTAPAWAQYHAFQGEVGCWFESEPTLKTHAWESNKWSQHSRYKIQSGESWGATLTKRPTI